MRHESPGHSNGRKAALRALAAAGGLTACLAFLASAAGAPKTLKAAAGPSDSDAMGQKNLAPLKIIVVSEGRNWKMASQVANAVYKVLLRKGRAVTNPAVEPVPSTDPMYREFRLAGIRGIRAFKKNDCKEAIRNFKQAIKRLEFLMKRYGPSEKLIQSYVRGQHFLGACMLKEANPEGAASAFRIAASFDPWGEPSAKRFSADAIKAYRNAKANAGKKTGVLLIRTNEPIRLFINGRDAGLAPQSIPKMPQGRYLLTLFRLGYSKVSSFVDIDAGGGVTWNATVSPDPKQADMGRLLQSVDRELKRRKMCGPHAARLAARLNTRQVIFCRASIDESEASWYDVAGKRFIKRVRRITAIPGRPQAKDVAEALVQGGPIYDLRHAVEVKCLTDADCPSGRCYRGRCQRTRPIYKKWWFWVAVGVSVAAAAALGAVIGTMPERPIIHIATPP